ncbi:MAG: RlmE family RNA methyltransferase [Deltaproteobacteria bacterium]|nr:RlmE family RNA methyltransferase [Deltaproteobacteria bacterium]
MSRLRDRRTRHDAFYRQAKRDQYAARSVYKLQELDQRFRLLGPGLRVLDLGCRPGSWLQYAAERVGEAGRVVGIDRTAVEVPLPAHVRVEIGDVLEVTPETLLGELPCFDVVLSDMAPDTTGIAMTDQARSVALYLRALELAAAVGCSGSSFVGKIFMGEGFEGAVAETKRLYARTKVVRPDATRRISSEHYLVAQTKK